MIRKIIKIEDDLCNGCGLCANACHESAIEIIDGKARLIRDDYCDGLGNCLPVCPTGAISFEEREALDFDEEAVKKIQEAKAAEASLAEATAANIPCGCPGSASRTIQKEESTANKAEVVTEEFKSKAAERNVSELRQWPVQIKLVPTNAPYFDNANLLIAADCTAYAYAGFHSDFIKNHVTLIGCPKLDDGDYSEKLTEIIKNNNIKSIKIVRMEVPCCGGIEYAAVQAMKNSGKMIPWQVVTISVDGNILDR